MSKPAAVLLAVATAVPAAAHDATPTAAQPNGWTYPFSCCSGMDCREIRDQAVLEGPRGYVIKLTGELIMPRDTRIKNSPDGQFHHCTVAGEPTGRTICLFVPPRSF
ncbi:MULTISPECIES: hypothetical protein [Sinorhizobium]|nr:MULTISPECIES: hypothetical protein [Sinorhizobium]ASY58764.1 hypothetical protein SS05631_c38580 [Sinorhizobium sp. CCBAU 05631]AUX74696.1 hypothetical protein NXT3_CH00080 [Sinorhizobium fredii]PDT32715.1 hypothetical protein CO656_29200 [Sinorhizobium sp. FG01]PDT47693.1 hypothetical protein CO664_29820 [Sinorhizobium sp. NG07B]